MSQPGNEKKIRTITLEEHFVTPAFMEGPGRELGGTRQVHAKGQPQWRPVNAHLVEQLWISMICGSPTWMPPASMCRCCR